MDRVLLAQPAVQLNWSKAVNCIIRFAGLTSGIHCLYNRLVNWAVRAALVQAGDVPVGLPGVFAW